MIIHTKVMTTLMTTIITTMQIMSIFMLKFTHIVLILIIMVLEENARMLNKGNYKKSKNKRIFMLIMVTAMMLVVNVHILN
jgi:uncharacterized membrane protein